MMCYSLLCDYLIVLMLMMILFLFRLHFYFVGYGLQLMLSFYRSMQILKVSVHVFILKGCFYFVLMEVLCCGNTYSSHLFKQSLSQLSALSSVAETHKNIKIFSMLSPNVVSYRYNGMHHLEIDSNEVAFLNKIRTSNRCMQNMVSIFPHSKCVHNRCAPC